MKRIVLFALGLLINTAVLSAFSFYVNADTKMFIPDEELNLNKDKYEIIKKGKIISCMDDRNPILFTYCREFSDVFAYVKEKDENGGYGYISINNLIPADETDLLSEDLVTIKETGMKKKYVPVYMLDILKSSDTEKLKKYDSRYALEYREASNDYIAYSFEKNFYYAVISNTGIRLHSDDSFVFTKIKKISSEKYECTGTGFAKWQKYGENNCIWQTYFENTSELGVTSETIELTIDGDYLKIYNKTRGKDIINLVCIDDSLERELINLFENNSRDLSNITWPRHADGTCDYDGSNASAKAASLKQNASAATTASSIGVSINKIMTANCNLKLRAAEATSSNVLTVMAQGTKVKILELGKAETIDGISSNWVKVEVQGGAKDRDGKAIAKGLVGWAYGGYLE